MCVLAALLTSWGPQYHAEWPRQFSLSQRTICWWRKSPLLSCVSVCVHLLFENVSPYAIASNIQHLNIQMAEHQSTQCFLPSPGSSLKTEEEDKYSSSGHWGVKWWAPASHVPRNFTVIVRKAKSEIPTTLWHLSETIKDLFFLYRSTWSVIKSLTVEAFRLNLHTYIWNIDPHVSGGGLRNFNPWW